MLISFNLQLHQHKCTVSCIGNNWTTFCTDVTWQLPSLAQTGQIPALAITGQFSASTMAEQFSALAWNYLNGFHSSCHIKKLDQLASAFIYKSRKNMMAKSYLCNSLMKQIENCHHLLYILRKIGVFPFVAEYGE